MGAITSDFPQLPQDADPARVALYTRIYADLVAIGLPVPATGANVITRAALLAHLQLQAGTIISNEVTTDPDDVVYNGGSDAVQANLFSDPQPSRVPGAASRYTATGVPTDTVITVSEGGLDSLGNLVGKRIRFPRNTATAALRNAIGIIASVALDNTITLQSALPAAPAVGERFQLFDITERRCRANIRLVGLPYAPNRFSATDIAGAKT